MYEPADRDGEPGAMLGGRATGRRRPRDSTTRRARRGALAAAAAIGAVLGLLTLLAGCGAATTIPTNAGASVDPSTFEFPDQVPASDRPLVDAADGFLAALEAEAWPRAYLLLDAASRGAETSEEFAARWQKSAVRLQGYELKGAVTVPGAPEQGVVRAELQVRNQKSDEIWLEYLWFTREMDEWRVASNSWK